MADPVQQPLFTSLVERFGLNVALQLLPFLQGDSSTASKAFAGAGLVGTGARAAGNLTGSPALAVAGQGIGTGLGLAGTGYNVYQTATNPNLSNVQKAGHSAGDAINALLSMIVPYYGLGVAARAATGAMQRSGSPQVRGAGRGIAAPAIPVEGLLSVLQGDKSFRGAGNQMVSSIKNIPGIGGPLGSVLGAFGLGTKPTTGTSFRNEVGSIFDKIPQLKGTDTGKYNIDPGMYAGLPQAVKDNATSLSQKLAGLAPHASSNLSAYQNQIAAMLLNRFGANLPTGMV